jgi:tetratricopeptide (TPR) repeat protein
MPQARFEEAVQELERALEWDPLSVHAHSVLAATLLLWRQYDRTLLESRLLLELEPQAYWGHACIAGAYRERGMFPEAIAAQRNAAMLSGDSSIMLGWLGLVLGLAGQEHEARTLLAQLHQRARDRYVSPASIAWICLGLGDIGEAFTWLDRAVEGCDQLMMPIKSYAFFDPIRGDSRFRALLRKMKLA